MWSVDILKFEVKNCGYRNHLNIARDLEDQDLQDHTGKAPIKCPYL